MSAPVAPVEPVADAPRVTDASDAAVPIATPFTMVTGDPTAMVCDGDVCFVPAVVPPA